MSIPAWTLREELAQDQPFLLRLYGSTRREELDRAGMPESFREEFLTLQFNAMTLSYRERFPKANWFVIESDGSCIGRMIVDRGEVEVRVVDFAILEEHRGQGIGTAVLKSVLHAAASSRKPVRLRTFLESRAVVWYRRLGFVELEDDGLRVHLEWVPGGEGMLG